MSGTTRHLGKHIVVTGAGSGIGRAIALRLANEGATLSLLGRRRDALEQTVALVGESARSVPFIASCDIRQRDQVDATFQQASQRNGPVHAVIANAGVGGPNEPGSEDRFEDLVQTNLVGTYQCLRAGERHLAGGNDPRHFLVVASILARIGVAGYTGYCASKAGLLGLVRAFAAELAPKNVQVNAVCPGWVATEMAWQGIDGFAQATGQSRDQAFADAMKPVPLGRMSEPAEIAGFVSFLVSQEARGITGQALDINNGAWMG